MMQSTAPSSRPRLAFTIIAAMVARVTINTARRFAYPFAPVLSRGLNVSLPAITSIIAANQITGILGLLFAPLGDRWGYRIIMLLGLGALTVGMLTGGALPFYATVFVALFLGGLGKSIFDPALQAYIGRRIPYARRGLAIGIIEMSWAGSSLVGIPLIGLLIHRYGWRSPFFALAGFGVLAMLVLGYLTSRDHDANQTAPVHQKIYSTLPQLFRKRTARGAIGFGFFLSAANDNLFVVYGAWLEDSFGLGIVALGVATTVIGIAELLGEILTATLADRLGLRRLITVGVILCGVSYLAIPAFGQTLPFALASLFFVFLTLEFSIVTSVSLTTELLPEARATMMAGYLAGASAGRFVGAFLGGPLWMLGGIGAVSCVSALVTGIALLSLRWGLSGWEPRRTRDGEPKTARNGEPANRRIGESENRRGNGVGD